MYYYEVLVSSHRYHGRGPLTYASETPLTAGIVVTVPMQRQQVLGIIYAEADKPTFTTKPVSSVVTDKPMPSQLLQLHTWLQSYYPAPIGMLTQMFLPASLATKRRDAATPKIIATTSSVLPVLTDEQQSAVATIARGSGSFMLHGETGTGKTRVYIELSKAMINDGKSAIIMTPEIGLTPQLTQTFEATFPGKVITVHSTQTPAERRDSWQAILTSSDPLVVIGPRSALFSPVHNLGLIVMDESHDNAYKQEQMPYYQTSRVAARLADLHKARLVLGTATPLIHDYFAFSEKNLPILRMEAPIGDVAPITTDVVNLREREHFSRSPWLSNQLITAVQQALHEDSQSLIFLNRRGTARLVLCQICGWQATCPRCDLPLTYHGDNHQLRCHTCGYTTKTPASCPDCGSTDIQFKSVGTKTIVSEVERLFPEAKVQRFDSDTKKSESLEQHYAAVQQGDVDILVGTQMLTKGLDLPKLAVVGVVIADTSLYFPDYTADERTFQVLRQVIGRVGRGHRKGHVVIQSYYPESPTIQAAIAKDYQQLYDVQLAERQLYRFPPYYFMLKVGIERATQPSARKAAQDLAEQILQEGLLIEIIGPSPAFVEKSHDRYRWQIVVKAKQRGELIKVIALLPKTVSYDIDPTDLL